MFCMLNLTKQLLYYHKILWLELVLTSYRWYFTLISTHLIFLFFFFYLLKYSKLTKQMQAAHNIVTVSLLSREDRKEKIYLIHKTSQKRSASTYVAHYFYYFVVLGGVENLTYLYLILLEVTVERLTIINRLRWVRNILGSQRLITTFLGCRGTSFAK